MSIVILVPTCERFLADLELLQQMGQQLHHGVVTNTAVDNVRVLVSSLHNLQPRLVNVAEPLRFLMVE